MPKKEIEKQHCLDFTPESKKSFSCQKCMFTCSKESDWNRHISTQKHQKLCGVNQFIKFTPEVEKGKFTCEKCNNVYKCKSGLWYHKQKCKPPAENNKIDEHSFTSMFLEMMKQNEDFKKVMIEQTTKMMEIAQNTQQQFITNNNTINNTMNNKFNLQIFLNETCKDAMNIQEFIDYVKVQHSDFENFGKYGYVESMTRIIMRNLMELEVHRRPIHCSDIKREVLYVKDNNVWVNDFSREKLIRAIKYIAAKNVKQIPDWMDHNPDSKNTQTKLHDKYMRMVCHSMGGRDEAEDQEYYKKIIHNVAKEVIIDKMK